MKTIAIATDGSDSAALALEFAIELARDTGASLQVLSVRPPRAVGRGGAGPAIFEVEEVGGAERIVEAAVQRAREGGVDAAPHVAHGDVVKSISEAASLFEAELLVVGSRGLGALSGAVLGSVSHALVRESPVPVTIVRHVAVPASSRA